MSGVDYAVLAIIVLSAGIGVWRGFVREALSLAIWIFAFWLAYLGSGVFEPYLSGFIADQALRTVFAFIVLFLGIHIVGFIVSRLLSTLIKSIGLKGVDRVLGAVFGVVRGAVVIAVLVLIAGLTPLAQESFWQQSYMIGVTEDALSWVQKHYPLEAVKQHLVGFNLST